MIKYPSHLMAILVIASMTTLCGAQKAPKTIGHFKQANNLIYVDGNDELESFFISHRPVTNREYILYLHWMGKTYGESYPEVIYEAWPGEIDISESEDYDGFIIPEMVKNSEGFVKEYIFNPEFIDFPVIGISWEQANDFCFWLSDRFNEYALIESKNLLWDWNQMNAECFVTESYLAGQYIGLVWEGFYDEEIKDYRNLRWTETNIAPSFRLPSKLELSVAFRDEAVGANIYPSMLYEYQFKKKDFSYLWWEQSLLFLSAEGLLFGFPNSDEPIVIPIENLEEDFPLYESFPEWCLDSKIPSENADIVGIYNEYGLKTELLENSDKLTQVDTFLKDSLGRMPYRILNVDKDIPTIVWTDKDPEFDSKTNYLYDLKNNIVVSDKYDRVFTCFRYAVSANWK